MNYVDFFSDYLGFDFKVDLKPSFINIEKKTTLSDRLKDSVFYYKSPNNTNTSFYLITTELSNNEFEEIRKYIWNKNNADIIFYYPNEVSNLEMFYAKYSPYISNNESLLDEFPIFSTNHKDIGKIEKIKHWQFDSGVFWFNYQSFIDKTKYKGIDKELVSTLKALKEKLYNSYSNLIFEEKERNKIVQALIDRTLYIKYLEDNHIINSHFYGKYFKDSTLDYGKLLENNSDTDVNKLFNEIHKIFNNALFDQPTIDDKYLNKEVRSLIAASFKADLNTGQLRLYDFQFNVLPVEFISYIYEVFLSEKQKENGIYYTPKKLAQLIIDDVIKEDRIGSILDPACGSGMFLIVGFQRLLEIAQKQNREPENNIEKIRYRINLLSENIFGIEKELTAQRFTLFSLSLQIFKNIPAEEIKLFIANELEQNNEIKIFKEFNFYKNIICQNSLDFVIPDLEGRKFDYIVGNPPFVRKEVSEEAKHFTNNFQLEHSDIIYIAKNIIDGYQISQCFLLRIKEWSDQTTRFGFISNNSNFYNEAEKFQKFFYSNYGIEKIYELSRVKDILFEKAKESVVAIVFNNNYQNNVIDYYTVDKGLFSEKPFELLIIQEDKVIEIEQEKLKGEQLRLRDFLVGNGYDSSVIKKLEFNSNRLSSFLDLSKEYSSFEGLKRLSNIEVKKYFKVTHKTTKEELESLHNDFSYQKYLSKEKDNFYNTPFIFKPEFTIKPFRITNISGYMNEKDCNKDNFQRVRNVYIYRDKKIVINRFGKAIQAAFSNENLFFSNLIYGIKLQDKQLYPLFLSLLNSQLINFYINLKFRLREDGNFSNVTTEVIKNIPIPKELDQDLVTQISKISKDLTDKRFEYIEKAEELNELIYDLYELSYLERQRIKDYFLPDAKKPTMPATIKNYEEALLDTLEFHFSKEITFEQFTAFNLIVVKICFGINDNPTAKKVGLYSLEQIFKDYQKDKFFLDQEFIFGKDCIYILKKDIKQNWTETKAFEDGQNILKFTPYGQ